LSRKVNKLTNPIMSDMAIQKYSSEELFAAFTARRYNEGMAISARLDWRMWEALVMLVVVPALVVAVIRIWSHLAKKHSLLFKISLAIWVVFCVIALNLWKYRPWECLDLFDAVFWAWTGKPPKTDPPRVYNMWLCPVTTSEYGIEETL